MMSERKGRVEKLFLTYKDFNLDERMLAHQGFTSITGQVYELFLLLYIEFSNNMDQFLLILDRIWPNRGRLRV